MDTIESINIVPYSEIYGVHPSPDISLLVMDIGSACHMMQTSTLANPPVSQMLDDTKLLAMMTYTHSQNRHIATGNDKRQL